MMRRLVVSPWGRGLALAVGLALASTMQTSADPPSADKPSPTEKSPPVVKAVVDQPAVNGSSAKKAPAKNTKVAQQKHKKKKWLPTASKLTLDPSALRVGLFEGMGDGSLNVKVVAQNQFGGTVYIENPSNKPLTVDMPDAFVAVSVLRQGRGGGAGGAGGAAGGQQAAGGGAGGVGGQGGFGGGGAGGGMFSIPPEHTAKIAFHSVCLEHGKADPDPTVNYKLIPVSQYTDNQQLAALLTLVARDTIDPQVAQAAAWNLSSNMSWQELASKQSTEIGSTDLPYFTQQALQQAQQLVIDCRGIAQERAKTKVAEVKKTDSIKSNSKSDDHVIQGR
jgi:hypothetical protein